MTNEECKAVIRGHVRGGVIVPDEAATLDEGAEVRIEVVKQPPRKKKRRQGGQWKGRVWIAPDFDELPDDIAKAFGMKDP